MTKNLKISIIGIIIFQIIILLAMLVKANMPLWFGTEIKIKVKPVDPRSMFRGNYVRLTYDFSSIEINYKHPLYDKNLRKGEKIYISFTKTDDIYVYNKISLEEPTNTIYIQGRIKRKPYKIYNYKLSSAEQENHNKKNLLIRIKVANISALFAPKEKALSLESTLKDGAVSVLMVNDNGKVMIKSIERYQK